MTVANPGRMYLGRAAALVLTPLIMVSACGRGPSLEGATDSDPVAQLRLRDGVGDVFLANSNDTDKVAQTVRNVDVVAATVKRTGRDLRVRITYHDLAPRASRNWVVAFNLVTSEDHFVRSVLWERGRYAETGAWTQGVGVTKETSEDSFGNPCPHGATAKVDYTTDTVTITVPNRCLGRTVPSWIRLDDLTTSSRAPHGINDYSDNPFNATGESESTPRLVAPAH